MSCRYDRALRGFRGEALRGEPLSRHTSYRIGGPADLYLVPADEDDLRGFLDRTSRGDFPLFILGNGSNLLVHDAGLRGAVVDVRRATRGICRDGEKVWAGAGAELDFLAAWAVEEGLEGLAELSGIPGTVGGALRTNAGAFGRTVSDFLVEVRALTTGGREVRLSRDELGLGYREAKGLKGLVVVSAAFHLKRGDRKALWEKRRKVLQQRSERQPLEYPSAGSTFKRPPGDHPGRLIEEAGCKGMRVGDAMVSPKHANFTVNLGKAKASDVWTLIRRVRERVRERFGVWLELEVELWGFPEGGLYTGGSPRSPGR